MKTRKNRQARQSFCVTYKAQHLQISKIKLTLGWTESVKSKRFRISYILASDSLYANVDALRHESPLSLPRRSPPQPMSRWQLSPTDSHLLVRSACSDSVKVPPMVHRRVPARKQRKPAQKPHECVLSNATSQIRGEEPRSARNGIVSDAGEKLDRINGTKMIYSMTTVCYLHWLRYLT